MASGTRSVAEAIAHMREIAKGYPQLEQLVADITALNGLYEQVSAESKANHASAQAWRSAALAQHQHALHAGNGLLAIKKLIEPMSIRNCLHRRECILEEIDKCLSQTVKHGSAPSLEKSSSR